MRPIFAFLFLIFTTLAMNAQHMSVQSFRMLERDLTAQVTDPVIDQNGQKSALIKVVTTHTGFEFDGGMLGIVKTVQKTAEIWVYVPHKAKALTIKHAQLGIIRNYAYPVPVEMARTYELVLVAGQIETIVKPVEIVTQWLVMASEPQGANVFINDVLVGTTPFQRQYPEDEYTYRVELPRYHTEAGKIDLRGERKSLNFPMRPRFGDISITSKPENGMQIYLNDENTGKTTPATLSEIASGEQTLKLISPWYQPQAKRVTVRDQQTATVEFVMEPVFSNITLKTTPEAEIFIDGQRKGSGTVTERMLPGIYNVKATKEKHHPAQQRITVAGTAAQTIKLTLRPQQGTLNVVTVPFDATITLDGKPHGTTPNTIRNLLVGTYALTLSKTGHGTVTKTVTIAEGQTTEVNETLPSGMEITIASRPVGAQLWIDGVSTGSTPYTTTLAFGSHSIKLVNGKKEVTDNITVSQNGKTRWEFDASEIVRGTFVDVRDGRTYKTVKIGSQVWMAENLTLKPNRGKYRIYGDDQTNLAKYGYLYSWLSAQTSCPIGWHLPTDSEWEILKENVGTYPGKKLKADNGWNYNGNGNNQYEFSALPGGCLSEFGAFTGIGHTGNWWSATEHNSKFAWYISLTYSNMDIYRNFNNKNCYYSVRCIKDN